MTTEPSNARQAAPPIRFDRGLSLCLDHLVISLERPVLRPAWRAWLRSLKSAAERQIPQGAVYVPKELRR